MRSRKEIMKEYNEMLRNDFIAPSVATNCLILEILLDIREMLYRGKRWK